MPPTKLTPVSPNRQLKGPVGASSDNGIETRSSGHFGTTPPTPNGECGSVANEAPASQAVEETALPSQIIPYDNNIIEPDPSCCNGAGGNELSVENDSAKTPPLIDTVDEEDDDTHPAKRQKTENDGDDDGLDALSEVGMGESAEDPKGPHHSYPGWGVVVLASL